MKRDIILRKMRMKMKKKKKIATKTKKMKKIRLVNAANKKAHMILNISTLNIAAKIKTKILTIERLRRKGTNSLCTINYPFKNLQFKIFRKLFVQK